MLFARANKARRNSELILNRHDDAAFAAAVEFGHDQAGESERIVKFARLTERVAAGGRIDDEQRLVRRVRIKFAESAFYFLQLGHQVCFRVLAAGGVAKQKIDLAFRCRLIRFVTKRGGIGVVLPANYFDAETFCPNVQLLDRRSARNVSAAASMTRGGEAR